MRISLMPLLALALALPAAALLMPAAALLMPAAALAQTKKPAAPAAPVAKSIGVFENWQAATYIDGGQTVCYAFARPLKPAKPIAGRAEPVLSVAERPTIRDAVALAAGFPYAAGAVVPVTVGTTKQEFYTAGSSAFARDGAAMTAAMEKGEELVAVSPGPGKETSTDRFSLKGFSAAHAAIVKACPPK
jgi:hypothetical protein